MMLDRGSPVDQRAPRRFATALAFACALALFTIPAAAQQADPGVTSRIEIVFPADPTITDPVNGVLEWRPIDASNPAEVAARDMVLRVIDRSYVLQTSIKDSGARLDSFHAAPQIDRWSLNDGGKIFVLIDPTRSAAVNEAYACSRKLPDGGGGTSGGQELFVKVDGGMIQGLPADQLKAAEVRVEEVLVHEFDHVNVAISEADFVANVKIRPELFWGGPGSGSHTIFTVSSPSQALLEGSAVAAQLFAFKEASFLYPGYREGFFQLSLWTVRDQIPMAKRILIRLAELSRSVGGSLGDRVGDKVLRRYGIEGFDDPIFQRDPSGTYRVRPVSDMVRTEGIVALVLCDLYEAGISSPEQVRDIVKTSGVANIEDLMFKIRLKAIEALPDGQSASMEARIEAIRSRRFLAADIDSAGSQRLVDRLAKGEITPGEFQQGVDDIIKTKLGERYRTTVVLPDPPKQEPLGGGVKNEATAAERIRLLLRSVGDSEFLRGQARFVMAFFIAHYAMNLIQNVATSGQQGTLDPVQSMKEALEQMMSPQFAVSAVLYIGSNAATDGALQGAAALAAHTRMAAWGPRLARLAQANARFGGILGMLVGGFLCRQVLAHDWSFLECPNLDIPQKVVQTLKTLVDFTCWDKKAWLELGLGTAGFGLVMGIAAAAGAPTAGIGAVAVLAVAIVVSALATLLADPIANLIDSVEYDWIKQSINWAASEYKKDGATADPGFWSFAWLKMDQEDKDSLKAATTVDQKREILVRSQGTSGDKVVSKFQCDPTKPPEMTKTVVKGLFKGFYEKRDIWLSKALNKLNEYMASKQTALEEAQKRYDDAANPLRQNAHNIPRLTLLFAWDRSGNALSAAEIADYVTLGIAADPELSKSYGLDPKSDADLNRVQANLQAEIQAYMDARSRPDLLRGHDDLVRAYDTMAIQAKKEFDQTCERWLEDLKQHRGEKLAEVKKVVEDELTDTDLLTRALGEMLDKKPDLKGFIDERKKALTDTKAYYDKLLEQFKQPATGE